jgi:hypothetical protein
LSNAFFVQNGLNQGDTLPALLSSFVLGYAIKKAQEKEGLELSGT